MDSLDDQYGYDVEFVSEVPDYLKCVVCHFVLRKPIQIIKCGHKFCEPCFNRMKSYSENPDSQLHCPVDRDLVDLDRVFEDNGIKRLIGDLLVKCGNNVAGCMWTGDLRDLTEHEEHCEHRVVHKLCGEANFQQVEGNSMLLKELCERMSKCEDSLVEKEKQIAFLKLNLQEVKKMFNDKLLEADALKSENKEIQHELKVMNNKNIELNQVEVKIENISLKNIILEHKVESLENQLLLSNKQLEDNKVDVVIVKDVSEGVKDMMENQQVEITDVKEEIKDIKRILDNQGIDVITVTEEVKGVKGILDNQNIDIATVKDDVGAVRNSLNKKSDEMKSSQLTTKEKEVEGKNTTLNDKIDRNSLKEPQEEIEVLKNHVANIENILFSNTAGDPKEIVLQWKLQHYQHHFDLGERVHSPMFFTEINGYCLKIRVNWNGVNKENLFLGIWLHRGSDYNKVLPPFSISYALELYDEDGDILSREKTLADIEVSRENCFNIPPGEKHAKKSHGFGPFITMPDLQKFIVNDTLSIRCRLAPLS